MTNSVDKTLNKLNRLYTNNLKSHGFSSKSVGWKDYSSQILRFNKLSQIIQLYNNNVFTVNDWGCGYGAMFKFLNVRYKKKLDAYYGYDISSEMIDSALHINKSKKAHFINNKDVTFKADYTFVSGTFNVKFNTSDKDWSTFIQQTLFHIAEKSRKGFSFNLLSSYVDWKVSDLYYADPLFYFDFCKKNISKYVSLIHDYPLYEWTICVITEK